LQYRPVSGGTSSQGESYYKASNPDFGALFTYYLPTNFESLKDIRQKKEKALKKENKDIPFPGWDILDQEKNEQSALVVFVITDSKGNFVTRINAPFKKGFNRVSWNLKLPIVTSLSSDEISDNPFESRSGTFAAAGTYTVTMYANVKGEITTLSQPQTFEVETINENVLKNPMQNSVDTYLESLKSFKTEVDVTMSSFNKASKRLVALEKATIYMAKEPGAIEKEISNLKIKMQSLEQKLYGNASKREIGEKDGKSVSFRLSVAQRGFSTTYGPTKMHMESLDMAKALFDKLKPDIDTFATVDIPALEKQLLDAGVPPILD